MKFNLSADAGGALPLVVTNTGREAAIQASNDGLQLHLTEIALGRGLWQPDGTATALQEEIKRLPNLGGSDVAPDMLHLTITDDSSDEYSLGEFGLYTDTGILFAIYSQGNWISEKLPESILMLSADIKLDTVPPGSVTIEGNNFQYPPATPTRLGVIYDVPSDGKQYARQSGSWVQAFVTGMTMPWPGSLEKIPEGWLHVNGQELAIEYYPDLFEVLGTLWGGDGVTTFALPPSDCFPVMAGAGFSLGDTGGASSHTTSSDGEHEHSITLASAGDHSHSITVSATTLSESQMPSHSHPQRTDGHDWDRGSTSGYNSGVDAYYKITTVLDTLSKGSSSSHTHSSSSNSTGSHTHSASSDRSGSHSHTVDTLPPYCAMAYIIKA